MSGAAAGVGLPGPGAPSYYGQPVVKEPEWTWEVPWYLFAGGLAGASSVLALVARRSGAPGLAGRARLVAAAGALVSPALLISDLGRPQRFYNMLRVFKPTSAMSMGSWLLSAYVPLATGAALLGRCSRRPASWPVLEGAAAALGLPMTTYTAVLLADSSIPVWRDARDQLPFVFASSAAASAGAFGLLLAPAAQAAPARRLTLAGAAAELVATPVMERRLGELAEPYHQGVAGRYATAARASVAAGAALVALGTRCHRLARVGACLVAAGGICLRWSVFRAGFASARDPKYTVGPQRRRLEERLRQTSP